MEKIWVRAIEPEDYLETHKWRTSNKTWSAVVGVKRFVSLETERKWVLSAIENHENGKVLRFMICQDNNFKPIGMITANNIDHINNTCGISSMVSVDLRGKGVIGEARLQVFDYLFSQLGINRISSQILEDNIASRRAVEKFGIQQEGILRNAVFKDGKYKNLICYSMLSEEFYSLYSERLTIGTKI